MNKPLMRSAISCAIACGAMVVGPAIVGAAVAKADLLGVGSDTDVLHLDLLGSGKDKKSRTGATGRDPSLPVVSTAPSTRNVVIRAKLPAAQADPEIMPAASFVPVADAPAGALGALVEPVPATPPPIPAAVPLSVPPPFPAAPAIRPPAPKAVPIPVTVEPGPGGLLAPADSYPPPVELPDSFRVGYAEYLRAATTSDLLVAALPGVAGIWGFTMLGAYAGYRQARAVQAALLPAVPTSILL